MSAVGQVLAGRYRLEEVIGRGGMSTVYRATDETLGRTVAVKLLLAALAEQDPAYEVRFEREARAAAALANDAVVTVYDTGLDEDSRYIVMEYVTGRSLEQILQEGEPLEIPAALHVASRVADALAAAHAAGILHRDIKPANVMVADDGAVKVLDFGIARRLDGTAITQVASVVGTAAYMAPERALGEPGDARADVYSLGCLMYAMLTGGPPFSGEVSAAVLHQQINAEPTPVRGIRPEVPPALDALLLAMLAKSPDGRPASAVEVRDALLGLAGSPATAATAPLTAATRRMPAGAAALAPGLGSAPRRGLSVDHRRRAIVMSLLTALITLTAVALLSGGGSPRKGTTRSSAATTPAKTSRPSAPAAQPTQSGPANSNLPPGQGSQSPGQGGQPPGQTKKHGHGHGGGGGNGGGGGGDGGD